MTSGIWPSLMYLAIWGFNKKKVPIQAPECSWWYNGDNLQTELGLIYNIVPINSALESREKQGHSQLLREIICSAF